MSRMGSEMIIEVVVMMFYWVLNFCMNVRSFGGIVYCELLRSVSVNINLFYVRRNVKMNDVMSEFCVIGMMMY